VARLHTSRDDETGEIHRTGTQAIERAVGLLRSLAADGELGITELAARQSLNPSTAHRIARALVAAGLLEQDAVTERYRLGIGLVELGLLTLQRLGIEAARPLLEGLGETTGESINLGVRRGSEVLVVLRVPSPQPLRFEQPAGSRVPIHTSAMGKALLAFAAEPDGEVDRLDDLPRLTSHTLTSRASLKRELRRTRERGYALNDEERNLGARAVGAAVLGRDGHAVAAISVQGPTVRLTDAAIRAVAVQVQDVARRVAAMLPAG
jgi:IclR family transcriptional regulator, acetate operon repressor